jgi:hypothetical protein
VLTVVLCACRADVRVDVALHDDGTGTVVARVSLDADAVRRVAGSTPINRAVPLSDLRAAGWTVSSWTTTPAGASVTLRHDFDGMADLERRLADLSGPTRALRDPTIDRTRGWLRDRDAIGVDVDLTALGAAVRQDAALASRLAAAGVDVAGLQRQLDRELGAALHVQVVVHAPDGTSRSVSLRAGQHSHVAVVSHRSHMGRLVVLLAGAALVAVALLLLVGASASARRERRRRPRAEASPRSPSPDRPGPPSP